VGLRNAPFESLGSNDDLFMELGARLGTFIITLSSGADG
jgi:hypothetical protein